MLVLSKYLLWVFFLKHLNVNILEHVYSVKLDFG